MREPLAILATVAVLGVGVAEPGAAGGATAPPIPVDQAHLSGSFVMSGRVTVARGIAGERVGQSIARHWGFHADCPTGACTTVTLVRPRATGRDTTLLHLVRPGLYIGNGAFFAPLRCGTHVWARGDIVPFTIAVRITTAALSDGRVVATGLSAAYTNPIRLNRTPCVTPGGHDAATYTGSLLVPAASGAT